MKRKWPLPTVLTLLLVLSAAPGAASPAGAAEAPARVFTAGPARVSLVELYTSEGCSSCPPAEA